MFTNPLSMSRHTVPNLVIAQRVINKMAKAAGHYLEDETGEAMVGFVIPGAHTNGVPTLYVIETIAPFEDSTVREWATFQQGDELQEEQFWWLSDNWDVYREKHHGKSLPEKLNVPLTHIGDWHKQPGFMIQPSQGDLMTARHMLMDSENGIDFLLAPIVTLGHPTTTGSSTNGNYIAVPQGDGTSMRVDFWYIDLKTNDFVPINPTIYPDNQLPSLPDYPWHMIREERYKDEYATLTKNSSFISAPVLWDTGNAPPLDVCFLMAQDGLDKALILVTGWDYPQSAPKCRVIDRAALDLDDNIYDVFEAVWHDSKWADTPKDWSWTDGKRLTDYVFAVEEMLGLKRPPPIPSPAPAPADAEKSAEKNSKDEHSAVITPAESKPTPEESA